MRKQRSLVVTCVACIVFTALTGFTYEASDGYGRNWSGVRSYSNSASSSAPDFVVTANPSFRMIYPGSVVSSNITVRSFGGFSGPITLADSVFAGYPRLSYESQAARLVSTSLNLAANGGNSTRLNFDAGDARNFVVNVTATSGGVTHSVQLVFQVVTFVFYTNPNEIYSIPPGGSGSTSLTIEGENGFSDVVSFFARVNPTSGLTLRLDAPNVTGPGSTLLTVTASSWSSGSYRIDLDARSSGGMDQGIFIWANVGVQPSPATPSPSSQSLFPFGLPVTIIIIAGWSLLVLHTIRQTVRRKPSDSETIPMNENPG